MGTPMGRKAVIIVLIGFFISHMLQAQCTIEGCVADERGEGLQGAVIRLDSCYVTTSGVNGKYRLSVLHLPRHNYSVAITYMGYDGADTLIDFARSGHVVWNRMLIPGIYNAPGVEIVGYSAVQRLREQPRTITMLAAHQLREMPVQTTDQALAMVNGVTVTNDLGIFDDKVVVSMHGLSGDNQSRTLVTVDGVPMNKADGGGVNWRLIDPASLEKVEVVKGPGCAAGGSGAMGGIVQMTTRKPEKKMTGQLQLAAATYNTQRLAVMAEGRQGGKKDTGWYWAVQSHALRSDGYVSQPEETILDYDTCVVAGYLKEMGVNLRTGYDKDAEHGVEVNLTCYDDKRGQGIEIYEQDGAWSQHDTWALRTKARFTLGEVKSSATLYARLEDYYRVNEYFRDGEYMLYDVDSRRTDWGGEWGLQHNYRNHHLEAGIQLRAGSVNGADIYYTSTDKVINRGVMENAGVYLQDTWHLAKDRLRLTGGLRYDAARFHDGEYRIEQPSYSMEYLTGFTATPKGEKVWDALTWNGGAVWLPNNQIRLYANVGEGFRAPVLDDMCRSGKSSMGFKMANPNLKPEYLVNVEVGAGMRWRTLTFSPAAYLSQGRDFQYLVSTGDSVNLGYTVDPVYSMANISRVNIRGVEADVKWETCTWLTLSCGYAYSRSQIAQHYVNDPAVDVSLKNKFLTRVPDHQLRGSVMVQRKRWSIVAMVRYTGARWINDRNTVDYRYLMRSQYPAYTVCDVRVRCRLHQHVELAFMANNLFNERFYSSKGYRSPGRMVTGQVNILW